MEQVYAKILEQITGGSTVLADQLIEKFVCLGEQTFVKIRIKINQLLLLDKEKKDEDSSELRQLVHGLKGSASYVFAEELCSACIELLNLIDQQTKKNDEILAKFNHLEFEFTKCIAEMKQFQSLK
jgi:HPt (histidine-containing phosphotransfer) domain-containing protein